MLSVVLDIIWERQNINSKLNWTRGTKFHSQNNLRTTKQLCYRKERPTTKKMDKIQLVKDGTWSLYCFVEEKWNIVMTFILNIKKLLILVLSRLLLLSLTMILLCICHVISSAKFIHGCNFPFFFTRKNLPQDRTDCCGSLHWYVPTT